MERAHLTLEGLVLVFQPVAQPAHLGARPAQLLVTLLAGQHVGKHLSDDAEAVDLIVCPRALAAHGREPGGAHHAAPDEKRHRDGRLRADPAERLAIAGVRRYLIEARDRDGFAAHHLPRDPREGLRGHKSDGELRETGATPVVRLAKVTPVGGELPQGGPVEIERLDDLALRVLDRALHLVWWQVHEAG